MSYVLFLDRTKLQKAVSNPKRSNTQHNRNCPAFVENISKNLIKQVIQWEMKKVL